MELLVHNDIKVREMYQAFNRAHIEAIISEMHSKVDFKVNDAAQVNIAKVSAVSEIYALIDSDLQEAASTLPTTWFIS